ncbi:amidase [Rhodobacterales bacterium]|nr:amidase [Rhodobacterales bacterium]
MTDFGFLSAVQIAANYREETLTPTVLVDALCERVATLDPTLHAMISFDVENVRHQAMACERELAAGLDRGPLHGIPVAIKDIIDVEGMATTCASAVFRDHVAGRNASVVSRLVEAGAIIFGKTNTHEFACGGPSPDLPVPPAANPWNPGHHPGGSSSGSGSGVAAGLFPLALGTDTGGSVRHPASACGVVGLKPTYGLVSRHGVFPLAQSLDCVGGLARTVRDSGLLLNALVGQDPADPSSVSCPWRDCTNDMGKGLEGVRIGYVRHFHTEDLDAPAETVAALDGAANRLRSAGAVVEEARLPSLESFFSVNRVLLSAEGFSIHGSMLREQPENYGALARRALLAGAFLSAEDYLAAQKLRKGLMEQMERVFEQYDVFLLASSMEPASRLDEPQETRRTYTRQARTPFSVTGHPALAMMAGLSKERLPLSLQFAAGKFQEAMLLRVAEAYETLTELPVHPPQFSQPTQTG